MSALHRKVLQLTRHYEPDGVIDAARAVVLVEMRAHARVVLQDEGFVLRTPTRVYQVPSVISLVDFHNVRKRRQESGKQRGRVFIRDRFRCQYCSKRFSASELTLDHILPSSRDGSDDPENLATSCKPCNQRKGNRTPDEARMPLLSHPSALRYGLDKAMLRHHASERPEWAKFLEPFVYLADKVA